MQGSAMVGAEGEETIYCDVDFPKKLHFTSFFAFRHYMLWGLTVDINLTESRITWEVILWAYLWQNS